MRNLALVVLAALLVVGVFTYQKKQKSQQQSPPQNVTVTKPVVTGVQLLPPAQSTAVSEIALEILEPKNGAVVSQSSILIRGKTSPKAEVFVNDTAAKADAQGNFAISVVLEEGDNTILVIANDEKGNYAEKELMVTLESVQ